MSEVVEPDDERLWIGSMLSETDWFELRLLAERAWAQYKVVDAEFLFVVENELLFRGEKELLFGGENELLFGGENDSLFGGRLTL